MTWFSVECMKYLISRKGKKTKAAHLWDGEDTQCRMFSTGHWNLKGFIISDSNYGLKICNMCGHVFDRKKKFFSESVVFNEEFTDDEL
jgi:hypothetical protein